MKNRFLSLVLALGLCLSAAACQMILPEPTPSPEEVQYGQAQAAYDAGNYVEARDLYAGLGDYEDSAAKVAELDSLIELETRYNDAAAALEAGDHLAAYRAFTALGDYRDSPEKLAEAASAPAVSELLAARDAEIDDIIVFGEYEQDNDLENGQEPLEWMVLDKQDGKVFLISRYGLDAEPYNAPQEETTWENCTLRAWLNGEFMDLAFTPEHQAMIAETQIVNEDNEYFSCDAGNDTVDKVYLMSMHEVELYFPEYMDNWTVATPYAQAHGSVANWHEMMPEYGNTWWWTRTPGNGNLFAVIVESSGKIKIQGDYVFRPYGCDRPVMWIDTSLLDAE